MEQFTLLEGEHTLKESREYLNNALLTVRSLSSGTAFPTTELTDGMLCYRTDLGRLYQLTDAASGVWTDKLSANISGTSNSANAVAWANVTDKPTAYPAAEHTHLYAGAAAAGGAAASADKLTTPRTINGTAFDGTEDITIVNSIAQGGTGATTASDARSNLGLDTAVTAASISGKNITLTKADGTAQTLTTQDTSPFTASAASIGEASTTKPAVVVTTYRSGTEWYRKWSDGWIEQGGEINTTAAAVNTISLVTPFAAANYFVGITHGFGTGGSDSSSVPARYFAAWNLTTSSFDTYVSGTANLNKKRWYACGV